MKIGLFLQPGFAAMDMTVDHAGKQGPAPGINDGVGRLIRQAGFDPLDSAVLDEQISGPGGALVYNAGIGNKNRLHAEDSM